VVTADGQVFTKGDIQSMVSIQSVSKVFTKAQVIEEQGAKAVMDKIGVDATGMRFNSIVAVEMQKGKEINPLVNPAQLQQAALLQAATLLPNGNTLYRSKAILQDANLN
jgi:glutaminase